MSFLTSVLFGAEGAYNIGPIQIAYKQDPLCQPASINGAGVVSMLANMCLTSDAFRWATQSYLHISVHEMGHAIACKLLTGGNSRIVIKTDTCSSFIYYPVYSYTTASDWKQSIIDFSGPMSNMSFSLCKLVALGALKNYIPCPINLTLGGGAIVWMSGELLYAYVSATQKQNNGDFGRIAQRSNTHLAVASAILISQYALGVFILINLWR